MSRDDRAIEYFLVEVSEWRFLYYSIVTNILWHQYQLSILGLCALVVALAFPALAEGFHLMQFSEG